MGVIPLKLQNRRRKLVTYFSNNSSRLLKWRRQLADSLCGFWASLTGKYMGLA